MVSVTKRMLLFVNSNGVFLKLVPYRWKVRWVGELRPMQCMTILIVGVTTLRKIIFKDRCLQRPSIALANEASCMILVINSFYNHNYSLSYSLCEILYYDQVSDPVTMLPGLISAFFCKSNKKQTRRTSVVLSLLLPVLVSSVFLAMGTPYLTLYQSQQLYHTSAKAGRTLLWDKRIIDVDDKLYVTGYIFGVFSAGFYVFARVPQIIKNVNLSLSPCLSNFLLWNFYCAHICSSCAVL